MKSLTQRQEIAEAINFGKYPVLDIDLSKSDEYGLKGCTVRIDMGKFNDGEPWLEKAEFRAYGDEKKLTFSAFACCLDANMSYYGLMDDVKTAQAPIVKPDSEICVVIHDSKVKVVYAVYIIQTGKVNRHCQTPIMVEKVDVSRFVKMAHDQYRNDMYGFEEWRNEDGQR